MKKYIISLVIIGTVVMSVNIVSAKTQDADPFALIWAAIVQINSKLTDLQNQINQRQSDISKLDEAIKQYEQQITDTSRQADSLKNAVNLINLNIKKLDSQISKTEKEIAQATAKIGDLNLDIKSTGQQIAEHQVELAALLRTFNRMEQTGLTEQLFGGGQFSDFWTEEERLLNLSERVREASLALKQLNQDLG